MDMRMPQSRQCRFSTQLVDRYQGSEKALVAALPEMDIHGVSMRTIKTITEELRPDKPSGAGSPEDGPFPKGERRWVMAIQLLSHQRTQREGRW
jgi:hypothetical protein